MTTTDVSVVRTDLDGFESRLRPVLGDYFEWADERAVEHFEELSGIDVQSAVESDLNRLATPAFEKPLFLALADDEIVGMVQLKRLSASEAEVKRLYVAPDYRGMGLGRELMETAVAEANADGIDTLRLGAAPYLDRARSLYEDLGFESTDRYPESNAPEAVSDEWCFMRRVLEN